MKAISKRPTPNERFAIWQSPRLQQMLMMRAAYCGNRYPLHWHETYVIQVVESGINEFRCGNENYRMQSGSILVLQPHEVHDGRSIGTSGLRYRSIYPSREFVTGLTGTAPGRLSANRLCPDRELWQQFIVAHRQLERNPVSIEGEELLRECLTTLFRNLKAATSTTAIRPGNATLEEIRARIDADHCHALPIRQLAAEACLSEFHFVRLFKSRFGMSPHQYIVCKRVERAKTMLMCPSNSIAEIANRAGFYDQSHLNRHFRRILGVTPGAFRSATMQTPDRRWNQA